MQSDYSPVSKKTKLVLEYRSRFTWQPPHLYMCMHMHMVMHMHMHKAADPLPAGITHGDRFMAATADGETVELECPENQWQDPDSRSCSWLIPDGGRRKKI